jgi:hypothetical protein
MLNRALISVCLGLALASCAGAPTTSGTAKAPPAAGASASQTSGCPKANGATQPAAALHCYGPESVYGKSDIDRTGEPTVGGALQNLSTTLTVHGNP